MARVKVDLPGRSYPVLVGQGALTELPGLVREAGANRVALITDSNVAESWLEPVLAALSGGGIAAPTHIIPAGESSKSEAELGRILGFLSAQQIDRRGLLIALGGGVVGD
ncbi:MAG: iron-containing alcohol dehydrogenase, partial [Candidatus Dormibacteraceae bacterium]